MKNIIYESKICHYGTWYFTVTCMVDGVTEDIVSMELPKEAYVELYTDSATSRYYMKDIEMIDMAKEEYIAAYPEYFV